MSNESDFKWADVSESIRRESGGIVMGCSILIALAILCLFALGSCTVVRHFDLENEKLESVSPITTFKCRHRKTSKERSVTWRCKRCGESLNTR